MRDIWKVEVRVRRMVAAMVMWRVVARARWKVAAMETEAATTVVATTVVQVEPMGAGSTTVVFRAGTDLAGGGGENETDCLLLTLSGLGCGDSMNDQAEGFCRRSFALGERRQPKILPELLLERVHVLLVQLRGNARASREEAVDDCRCRLRPPRALLLRLLLETTVAGARNLARPL